MSLAAARLLLRRSRFECLLAVVFRFVDVTNRGPDQSMLIERTLRLAGDSFDDTEVYQAPDGTKETTTNRFTRVRGR
jgi:hypothetical protein